MFWIKIVVSVTTNTAAHFPSPTYKDFMKIVAFMIFFPIQDLFLVKNKSYKHS